MKRFLILALSTLLVLPLWAQPVASTDSLVEDTTVQSDVLQSKEDSQSTKDSQTQEEASSNKSNNKNLTSPPAIGELISFSNLFWSLIFIVIGHFTIKLASRVLEIFAERSTQYRITVKSIIPVVKIAGWITVACLIVIGIYQPPAATVLAFSASIGVAVGFASQDILKNIFGGIIILFDRPFNSGDKIQVGDTYGEVVMIGLRSTRIVTPDDNLVTIPNGEIMNSAVANANAGEPNCQVVAEVYLPIDVDTVLVRSIATQAAQVSKYVFLNKPIVVIFANEYKEKESVLKMKIKAYVLDIRDEFKFKSEMTEIVLKKLLAEGIIQGR
ncbi:MAG: mechanosensitive ion channel domain-containing protein [Reichenbachiella sp.]|uniref:mechanosensitive ion channel family protein n=1 Tax=Reichenbachiella sp. TaxID=2184521 RepID=UPI00326446BD